MLKYFFILTSCCIIPVLIVNAIPQTSGCFKDGKYYQDGSNFQPRPCEHCSCNQGNVSCTVAECLVTLCVDPINDPNMCCPVCPNGRNCLARDRIIPAGRKVYLNEHTICQCPDRISLDMTVLVATCYQTVDSLPIHKVVGK